MQPFREWQAVTERTPNPTAENTKWSDDKDDEWTNRIERAHPLKTSDYKTYAQAMQMVGNRHSKYALVDLVNWLLKGQP